MSRPTTTLVTDPFEDDARSILEWAYGRSARTIFDEWRSMGQRSGQAFMNVLRNYAPAEYERLVGTLADPFHRDENLPAAIDRLTSK